MVNGKKRSRGGKQGNPKNSKKSNSNNNNNNQKQKGRDKSSSSDSHYRQSCDHFKFINEQNVRSAFKNKTLSKALSGKQLTRNEREDLKRQYTLAKWHNVNDEDPYLCLVCGQVVDKDSYDSHFKGNHCLALSYESQTITCTKCNDEFGVDPGTLVAELLGIEKMVTPLTVAAAATSSNKANSVIKEKEKQMRGLINLGNSCWMNSVIQILSHIPLLEKNEFLASKPNANANNDNNNNNINNNVTTLLSSSFCNLKTEILNRNMNGRPIRPTEFVSSLGRKIDFLSVHDQQDAYEFLVIFLDVIRDEQGGTSIGLNSDEIEAVKNCLKTPVDDLFAFILKTDMKCDKCQITKTMYERVAVLTLFIPFAGGATTLLDCMKLFFSDSSPDEEHECEFCNQKAECIMTPSLSSEHTPKVLVIHLSRFRMGKNGFVKNNVKVDFPEVLNFEEIDENVKVSYSLYGYVTHYGSIDSGHYTALAKVEEQFYLFDDETVSAVDKEKGFELQPYIMFYIKNE